MRTEEELSSGAGTSGPLPYAGPISHPGNGGRPHRDPTGTVGRPPGSARSIHEDPTIGHAVSHSFTAAKSMVADRLALLRVEVQQAITRLASGGVLLAAGAVVLVHAWFALAVGAVLAMGVWWGATLSLPVRLLIVTLATAALGGGLLAAGLTAMRRSGDHGEDDRTASPTGTRYGASSVRPV